MKTSEKNPACVVSLIDGSGSTKSFKKKIAYAVNSLILSILLSVPSKNGKPKDIIRFSCLRFNGAGYPKPALSGALAKEVVSLTELEANPFMMLPPVAAKDAPETPVWVDPEGFAFDGTPMLEALETAEDIISAHRVSHPDSENPLVMLVTDGEPTSGDPSPAAERIKNDHGGILMSIHINDKNNNPTIFPENDSNLCKAGKLLYSMSSEIPQHALNRIESTGVFPEGQTPQHPKAFIFNGDVCDLTKFLEMGTMTQKAL